MAPSTGPIPGGLKAALGRPSLLLILLALVAALRSVDRNLTLAVERHDPLDLGWLPASSVVAAAIATVLVLWRLRAPTPDGVEASHRFTVLWRLAQRVGLAVAAARVLTETWTLIGPDTPSRFAGVTGAGVLAATVFLIALYGVETLSPGKGVAADREHQTLRSAGLVRLSLGTAWAFAGLALAAPYAADQVGDLVLAWTDDFLPPAASFGVAGVLLFGLVLQEGALALVGVPEQGGASHVRVRPRTPGLVRLIAIGFTAGSILVLVLPGNLDLATTMVAIPVGLVVLSEWSERKLPVYAPDEPGSGASFVGIAILPLFALAGGLVNATVDALFLYGRDFGYLLRAVPPTLAILVAVGVLVSSSRSLVPDDLREESLPPWFVSGLALALIAGLWWAGSARLAGLAALLGLVTCTVKARGQHRLWAVNFGLAAGAALVVATLARPIPIGIGVGTIGAITIVLAALFSIVQYLVRLYALVELPRRFRHALPFEKLPVLTVIGAWTALAFLVAPQTAHDVRLTAPGPGKNVNGVEVEVALAAWWKAQSESSEPSPSSSPVPLVLVAAEGGGLRAAYWTGGVLDVLAAGPAKQRREVALPPPDAPCSAGHNDDGKRIFLISGASGGSVGAYAYARELTEAHGCLAPGWYARWFSRDLLGPVVSWGLVHDLFAAMFHQRPGVGGGCSFGRAAICDLLRDRARILEEGLDPDAAGRGIGLRSAVFKAPAPLPQLAFNSASDDLKTRVTLSTLRLPPRADVVAPALDGHCRTSDLPLVSAAVLSARFPVATSAGRIACAHRSLVDGGYLENTGIATIAELIAPLAEAVRAQNAENRSNGKPAIRIVVVEISNGPRGPQSPVRAPKFPARQPAPKFALLSLLGLPPYPTASGRAELGSAVVDACKEGVAVGLVTVRPQLAVGWKASVGWRLSRAARQELEQALAAIDVNPVRQARFRRCA